jgi:hypothetical protein
VVLGWPRLIAMLQPAAMRRLCADAREHKFLRCAGLLTRRPNRRASLDWFEQNFDESTALAEKFAAKLSRGFAALLKQEVLENVPPLLRVQRAITTPARYLVIKC